MYYSSTTTYALGINVSCRANGGCVVRRDVLVVLDADEAILTRHTSLPQQIVIPRRVSGRPFVELRPVRILAPGRHFFLDTSFEVQYLAIGRRSFWGAKKQRKRKLSESSVRFNPTTNAPLSAALFVLLRHFRRFVTRAAFASTVGGMLQASLSDGSRAMDR